jgi:hypothetical protein
MRMTPRDTRPHVSFVLPSYNEETNILTALDQTVRAATKFCAAFEVIVVDDGSSDRTAELVRSAQDEEPSIKLVSHSANRGYGGALRSGFEAAQLEWVFFTDADNQFDMGEIELLLTWAETADVVAGYRRVRQDPLMRKVNAWGWNRIVRWLFYVPVRDIDCAFKLFRRSTLQEIDIDSRGAMINTEIMVKLARRGCKIVEVGVSHYPRTSGAPQGAKVRVIARALREVRRMYPNLTTLAPREPDTVVGGDGAIDGRNGRAAPQTRLSVAPDIDRRERVTTDTAAEGSIRSVVAKTPVSGTNEVRRKTPSPIGTEGNGAVGMGAHGDVGAEHG